MENLGMKVTIKFKKNSIYNGSTSILHNITEIHHNYNTVYASEGERIAFESDIHSTGCTYEVNDIQEYMTSLESEKSESF
jgi:hypothetical protein